MAESPLAVAEVMMNQALSALGACDRSEPVVDAYCTLGEVVWDDCCGVLIGVPLRVFKTASFPNPVTDYTNCGTSELAVEIAVVLLRCSPVIEAHGGVPASDVIEAAAVEAAHDAAVVLNALLGDLPEGWERALVEQTIENEGGCIAIDTRMTIGLPQNDWCLDCGAP